MEIKKLHDFVKLFNKHWKLSASIEDLVIDVLLHLAIDDSSVNAADVKFTCEINIIDLPVILLYRR